MEGVLAAKKRKKGKPSVLARKVKAWASFLRNPVTLAIAGVLLVGGLGAGVWVGLSLSDASSDMNKILVATEREPSDAKLPPPVPRGRANETPLNLAPQPDSERPERRLALAPVPPPKPQGPPQTAPVQPAAVPGLRPVPTPGPLPPGTPAWVRNAVAVPDTGGPKIAIVIDDAGLDLKAMRRMAQNNIAPLTIAFLPYAENLQSQVDAMRQAGHEIIVHMPMEPQSAKENPGPNAILTGLPDEELLRRVRWNLDRLDGYVGVNNHMGSRMTADPRGMALVMSEMRARGLMFLDSRTTAHSVAAQAAEQYGVPNLRRDIFLDNDTRADKILEQLRQTEEMARKHGHAIAIGHAHIPTVEVLEQWAPVAIARGFTLVPLTALMKERRVVQNAAQR